MKKYLILLALISAPLARAQVTSTANSVVYNCTGATGPYQFTFSAYDAGSMDVIETVISTGSGSVISPGNYTITPVNLNFINGGSVTLNTACPSGNTITLQRETEQTQLTVFYNNMPTLYSAIQGGLDKLTMIAQDLQAEYENHTVKSITPGAGITCTPDVSGKCSGDVTLTGGGVNRIVAGANINISPAGGTGVVTINSTGGGGGGGSGAIQYSTIQPLPSTGQYAVIGLGDSKMAGGTLECTVALHPNATRPNCGPNGNQDFVSRIVKKKQYGNGRTAFFQNSATGGGNCAEMQTDYTNDNIAQYAPGVGSNTWTETDVWHLDGVNDATQGVTLDSYRNCYSNLLSQEVAAGLTPIILTSYWGSTLNPTQVALLKSYNVYLRSLKHKFLVIDLENKVGFNTTDQNWEQVVNTTNTTYKVGSYSVAQVSGVSQITINIDPSSTGLTQFLTAFSNFELGGFNDTPSVPLNYTYANTPTACFQNTTAVACSVAGITSFTANIAGFYPTTALTTPQFGLIWSWQLNDPAGLHLGIIGVDAMATYADWAYGVGGLGNSEMLTTSDTNYRQPVTGHEEVFGALCVEGDLNSFPSATACAQNQAAGSVMVQTKLPNASAATSGYDPGQGIVYLGSLVNNISAQRGAINFTSTPYSGPSGAIGNASVGNSTGNNLYAVGDTFNFGTSCTTQAIGTVKSISGSGSVGPVTAITILINQGGAGCVSTANGATTTLTGTGSGMTVNGILSASTPFHFNTPGGKWIGGSVFVCTYGTIACPLDDLLANLGSSSGGPITSIGSLTLLNGGQGSAGFTNGATATIVEPGASLGTVVIGTSNGAANAYTVTNIGSGYTLASCVPATGGSGTGVSFNITNALTGTVNATTMCTPGSGVTAGDVLTLTQGSNTTAQITVSSVTNGAVTSLSSLSNQGLNYATTVSPILPATLTGGTTSPSINITSINLNAGGLKLGAGKLDYAQTASGVFTFDHPIVVPSCTGCGTGSSGVTSINGTAGAFTFTGSGVTCTTTTCTFTGTALAAQAADTWLANATGSSAVPTAVSIPNCTTGITYSTSTHSFGCASAGGTGTVTSVSVTTANGVSGSVATATTTPAITLTLGAITPSSVAATGSVSGTQLIAGSGSTACGSATGCIASVEASTAGTPTALNDYFRANSSNHFYMMSLNNGAEFLSLMNFSSIALGTQVTGLLANSNIANPQTTVNGQTCTLGSTCTVSAAVTANIIDASTNSSGVVIATPLAPTLNTFTGFEQAGNGANTVQFGMDVTGDSNMVAFGLQGGGNGVVPQMTLDYGLTSAQVNNKATQSDNAADMAYRTFFNFSPLDIGNALALYVCCSNESDLVTENTTAQYLGMRQSQEATGSYRTLGTSERSMSFGKATSLTTFATDASTFTASGGVSTATTGSFNQVVYVGASGVLYLWQYEYTTGGGSFQVLDKTAVPAGVALTDSITASSTLTCTSISRAPANIGTTWAGSARFTGLTPGYHTLTVNVTSSGKVGIIGFGSPLNKRRGSGSPTLVWGNTIHEQYNANGTFVTNTNANENLALADLIPDGFNITVADLYSATDTLLDYDSKAVLGYQITNVGSGGTPGSYVVTATGSTCTAGAPTALFVIGGGGTLTSLTPTVTIGTLGTYASNCSAAGTLALPGGLTGATFSAVLSTNTNYTAQPPFHIALKGQQDVAHSLEGAAQAIGIAFANGCAGTGSQTVNINTRCITHFGAATDTFPNSAGSMSPGQCVDILQTSGSSSAILTIAGGSGGNANGYTSGPNSGVRICSFDNAGNISVVAERQGTGPWRSFNGQTAGTNSPGMAYIPGVVHLTAQTASITSQTLVSTGNLAAQSPGHYQIQCSAAASAATAAALTYTISFADPFAVARTYTSSSLTLGITGVQNTFSPVGIQVSSGTAITVTTTLTGTATYNFDCGAVRLF